MGGSLHLILLAVACSASGQIVLKLGMSQVGRVEVEHPAQALGIGERVLTNPLIVVGLFLFVVGAGLWLAVLSRVPLSLAHPVLALTYVVTPLLAWLILGEGIPLIRWLGIAIICFGVLVVSRS